MTDPQFFQVILCIFSAVLGTALGAVSGALKNRSAELRKQREETAKERIQNRAMIGELMFCRIEDLHHRYVIKGEECSAADKQQVEHIYRHYHDVLGLNGAGTQMYEEIMQLR